MTTPRARIAVALGTLVLVACGGTVVPVGSSSSGSSGSSSSSGASGTSGGSSSGASSSSSSSSSSGASSGSSSSSGASGTSGTGSSGSSGGVCYPGELGPPDCFGGCGGGPPTPEICVNGQFTCPPAPPCPPPICGGPPPICGCPANCKCGATCDPSNGGWTCQAACEADAGAPFACGNKNCVPGDVCIDVGGVNGGPDTGPYECLPNPAICANDYSCGCEQKAIEAAGTCTTVGCDQTFGNVVVHCKSL